MSVTNGTETQRFVATAGRWCLSAESRKVSPPGASCYSRSPTIGVMQVTRAELVESTDPVDLPEPWVPAWSQPDGEPTEAFDWSVVRLHTDEGVTGVGPATGRVRDVDVVGVDPSRVGEFWHSQLSGKRAGNAEAVAGVEIALWDAYGKCVGEPIYELLGGVRDDVPVYAATSRLLPPDDLAEQVRDIAAEGFGGVKLRAHRPDPREDVRAVRAVRDAVGADVELYVDANQNNASDEYEFWSRRTARTVARELDDIGVDFLEEPRPRRDVEGLAELRDAVEMSIAGGEHSASVHEFKRHLLDGAYDVLQPDVWMFGNMGITGVRQTATVAEFFDRTVVPHVVGNANTGLGLAATLHAAGSVAAIPMVEYPHDPPVLTPETLQPTLAEPLRPTDDGRLPVPDGPGLGVDLDEDELDANGEVVWSAELSG